MKRLPEFLNYHFSLFIIVILMTNLIFQSLLQHKDLSLKFPEWKNYPHQVIPIPLNSLPTPRLNSTGENFSFYLPILLQNGQTGSFTPTPTPTLITTNIIEPITNTFVGDRLHIIVRVVSVYQLQSVWAEVESRQVSLVYAFQAYCSKAGCFDGWIGDLSVSGLSRGSKIVTATATDVYSNTGQSIRAFIHDYAPIVTVTLPINDTVARPGTQLDVACSDDDPAGCKSLHVYTSTITSQCADEIASGISRIDQTVSLSSFDGQTISLCFQGEDSVGQKTIEYRTVWVESSNHLSEVKSVSGRIWDVEPDRILFLDNLNILKIHYWPSGQEDSIPSILNKTPFYGYLTPKGAIFITKNTKENPGFPDDIYEWRDGSLIDFGISGIINSPTLLKVNGNYAIWNSGQDLFLYDLITGTSSTVATDVGNIHNDIAANGDIVYWSHTYQIFRFRMGITTQLTNDANVKNFYPATDGINVVYVKSPSSYDYALAMYGISGETILAPSRQQVQPNPGLYYQLNNGWVAYTKLDLGGQYQVWTLSPSGVDSQVSFFGTSSLINSLAPNGEVTFINGNRLYLARPGSVLSDISSKIGKSFWQNGQWYLIVGRSLFLVIW